MPIKFLKTQQKFKKSLAKEFETFNEKSELTANKSPKYESDVVKKSPLSQNKPPKSQAPQELTTQAKSPHIKSPSDSKSQLAPYHKPQSLSGLPSNNQSHKSSKKSLHQSLSKLRPLTPAEQLTRSRQSSPQAQRVYSKMSTYDKRAYSKMSNYKKPQPSHTNNHDATYGVKSSSKASLSKVEKEKKTQFLKKNSSTAQNLSNEKWSAKIKKPIKINESDNFQISFPQMITESESAYPSSSHPNTGKESEDRDLDDWQEKRNSNITEEEQNEIDEPIDEDYISEGQFEGQQMAGSSQRSDQMGESGTPSHYNQHSGSGYNQLPKSYLIAMEILQAKVLEQQSMIKKLRQRVGKQDKKYKNLQIQLQSLQCLVLDKQNIISLKDAQIKFLKGYLDEEKHNNREALKEVAKNVYQRSISVEKNTQKIYQNSSTKSIKKTTKQLFTEEEKQNNLHDSQNPKTNSDDQSHNQINFQSRPIEQNSQGNQHTSNQVQSQQAQPKKNHFIPKSNIQQSQPKAPEKKLSKPQIKQQKFTQNSTQTKQKYSQLKRKSSAEEKNFSAQQKFARQELLKDQLMREQILREQAIQNQTGKKYNYLERSRKNNRSVSAKQDYPYTIKKIQNSGWDSSANKKNQGGERQLYSEEKRIRSMSTAVKYLDEQKNPNITYRPRNTQTSNITPNFSYQGPPTSVLNHSVQSIMDPVLERYIQAKSDISSYRFNNDIAFTNEFLELKSDKKNRQAVSEMRELMRGEKQLVALNYRLEAIEKRILECVRSTGKTDQLQRTIKEQADEKILLEDLQRQYAVLKKEFERKEILVKQLKINLEQK